MLRLCATIALTLCVVGSAYGQTPDPPVCNRTEEVRDAIVAAVPGISDCQNVTSAHLSTIERLNLSNRDITALRADDFNGLTGIANSGIGLNLRNNLLQTLPAGIFDDLPQSANIETRDNPFNEGLPLALVNDLKIRNASANIETDLLKVQDVLPAQLVLSFGEMIVLDLEGAFIEFAGNAFPAGDYIITVVDPAVAMASDAVNHRTTITDLAVGGETEIRIIGVSAVDDALSSSHTIVVVPNPAEIPNPLVCDRTLRVQVAILAIPTVSATSCNQVTLAHLAGIGRVTLAIFNATTLKAGDFNDMPNIANIDIRGSLGNRLETLPAGMFKDVRSDVPIDLRGNPFSQGLPSELIDRFRSRSGSLDINLVAVNDILPATLRVSVGNTEDLDLTNAFFQSSGHTHRSASSYEITPADPTVAETQISDFHTLTVTTLDEGETMITVTGIRDDQRVTQTFTVTTEAADNIIFRIKVFLEGAQ